MSNFCVYVSLPLYLSEWLHHRLGDPVRFPQHSNENAVIRTFLRRLPPGQLPQTDGEGLTAIAIPDSASKPAEVFNYLGEKGRRALVETIKDLFIRALWSDISPLSRSPKGLNALIEAWCEANGIGLDRVETVRQCYYRIRRRYARQGINIKKSSRN